MAKAGNGKTNRKPVKPIDNKSQVLGGSKYCTNFDKSCEEIITIICFIIYACWTNASVKNCLVIEVLSLAAPWPCG